MNCRDSLVELTPLCRRALLALVGLLPLASGCQEPNAYVPVRGTVTLDGKPLGSGTVQFQPSVGQVASGELGPDGTFTLSTPSGGNGVLAGTYRVTVVAYDPMASEQTVENLIVPLRYTRSGTSGLQVTIFPGSTSPVALELVSDDSESPDATPDSPAAEAPTASPAAREQSGPPAESTPAGEATREPSTSAPTAG